MTTLAKYWIDRLSRILPQSSIRMRTRMAWRLAALDIRTDDGLARLGERELVDFFGGSRTFLQIRNDYLRQRQAGSSSRATTPI